MSWVGLIVAKGFQSFIKAGQSILTFGRANDCRKKKGLNRTGERVVVVPLGNLGGCGYSHKGCVPGQGETNVLYVLKKFILIPKFSSHLWNTNL